MDARIADHVLSESERAAMDRDGYLHVRGALDPNTVARLLAAARLEDDRFRSTPTAGRHHVLNLHDLVGRDAAWLELIDWPTTFGKVFGVLGWHIQLFHTQLIVTPPAPSAAHAGSYGWHQDNNRVNLDLETTPQPRLSVKVGYFLTDLPEPGMGNLAVAPGSHRRGRPTADRPPDGAIELTAAAGDAVLFDRRLWHAASTNMSDRTRVFVTYGYSYRWLRPKSAMQHTGLLEHVDPIRRQLLGASSSANAYYDPTDDDVPLRTWMREHLGEQSVSS